MEEGSSPRYYLLDELGSPLRVQYATGRGECYGYDEFGRDLAEEKRSVSQEVQEVVRSPYARQGSSQPFGYTGCRYDGISGSYFAQAREYQPHTGRFMAEDVIRGRITVPKTLNRYGYCLSNPMRFVDLDGRTPILSPSFLPSIIGPPILFDYIEKAEEIYNKQREEVPAPQLSYPTDISDLPDYTEIIDEWMDEKVDMFQKMQERGEVNLPVHMGNLELGLKLYNDTEILIEFYNQVKTTGDMDIKQDESWQKAFGFSRPEYFIYHGEVMDPGTMGNIAYGYVGASLYPDLILYMGGGAVNMKRLDIRYVLASPILPYYGDSPEDHEAIKKGIEMWLEGNSCEN